MAFSKVVLGQSIRLSALFRDGQNDPIDPDYYSDSTASLDSTAEPQAIIYDPSENVVVYVDADNIVREDTGFFYYDHAISSEDTVGVYRIRWSGTVSGVPIIYDDYFQVIGTPVIISDTLIARIQRELKDRAAELDDQEFIDVQSDAEADVMEVSQYGLAWHNKWEILWLTKRGVRHSLQRILNNWIDLFSIGKGGKSLALDQPARAIMARITQIDNEFERAKKERWFDGVHWIYRAVDSATTSSRQTMAYDVDIYTGEDRTQYYDPDGELITSDDEEEPWRDY